MTRLRKRMLEELQRRNYSTVTTRNYLRVVAEFAKFFGKSPDKLGLNELRTYQAYLLRVRKLTPGTDQPGSGTALFFVKTLKRHRFRDFLPYPQDQRRLPTVLSREEVSRLINKAGTLFRRTLLMTLYGTGMRRSELAHLNHPSSRRQAWQGSRFALCLATADRCAPSLAPPPPAENAIVRSLVCGYVPAGDVPRWSVPPERIPDNSPPGSHNRIVPPALR